MKELLRKKFFLKRKILIKQKSNFIQAIGTMFIKIKC